MAINDTMPPIIPTPETNALQDTACDATEERNRRGASLQEHYLAAQEDLQRAYDHARNLERRATGLRTAWKEVDTKLKQLAAILKGI